MSTCKQVLLRYVAGRGYVAGAGRVSVTFCSTMRKSGAVREGTASHDPGRFESSRCQMRAGAPFATGEVRKGVISRGAAMRNPHSNARYIHDFLGFLCL